MRSQTIQNSSPAATGSAAALLAPVILWLAIASVALISLITGRPF